MTSTDTAQINIKHQIYYGKTIINLVIIIIIYNCNLDFQWKTRPKIHVHIQLFTEYEK